MNRRWCIPGASRLVVLVLASSASIGISSRGWAQPSPGGATGTASKPAGKASGKTGAAASSAPGSDASASPAGASSSTPGPATSPPSSSSSSSSSAPLGAPLPGADLPLLPAGGGSSVTFGELLKAKDRVATVTVFMSSRCPYVAEARQPLAELARTWAGKVVFVGVVSNQNETADELRADATAHDAFPLWRDEQSRLADALGARHTPEVFVADAAGTLRYHGGVSELGAALSALAAKKPVARAEVAAFGCTIKRKK